MNMKPIRKISRTTPVLSNDNADPVLISRSIHIIGELQGNEDVIVDGRVAATIRLGEHLLVVSKQGRVDGDVHARVISIEGHVEGDLQASEQVIVRRSGRVLGSITAPRVALDFGCWFSGTIHMDVDESADTSLEAPNESDNVTAIQSTTTATGAGIAGSTARKGNSDRGSVSSSGRTAAPRSRLDG